MKRIALNGFYVCASIGSAVAMIQDKWLLAIWLALILVCINLDEIHDTLKSTEKGQP